MSYSHREMLLPEGTSLIHTTREKPMVVQIQFVIIFRWLV